MRTCHPAPSVLAHTHTPCHHGCFCQVSEACCAARHSRARAHGPPLPVSGSTVAAGAAGASKGALQPQRRRLGSPASRRRAAAPPPFRCHRLSAGGCRPGGTPAGNRLGSTCWRVASGQCRAAGPGGAPLGSPSPDLSPWRRHAKRCPSSSCYYPPAARPSCPFTAAFCSSLGERWPSIPGHIWYYESSYCAIFYIKEDLCLKRARRRECSRRALCRHACQPQSALIAVPVFARTVRGRHTDLTCTARACCDR